MKSLKKSLGITVAILALCAGVQNATAQPDGNFDPAQMRQAMLDRMREQFDVKDDKEWKILKVLIVKIQDSQRATRSGMMGGFGGGRGPGGPGGFGGQPNPEADALRTALEAKASSADIKEKLAKLRASRADAEAKLESAQEELIKVLSVQQEAVAVMSGLLK